MFEKSTIIRFRKQSRQLFKHFLGEVELDMWEAEHFQDSIYTDHQVNKVLKHLGKYLKHAIEMRKLASA